MRQKLQDGLPLCVFAEGGISRTGSIFPFKRGALLLAKQAKVPIVPVHIDGVWGSIFSMERGKFFFKKPLRFPYRVCVRIGKAIEANSFDTEGVRQAVMNLGREIHFRNACPILSMLELLLIDPLKTDQMKSLFLLIINQ